MGVTENKSLQVARIMWPEHEWAESSITYVEDGNTMVDKWAHRIYDPEIHEFDITYDHDHMRMAHWLAKKCSDGESFEQLTRLSNLVTALASENVGDSLADLVIQWGE